VAHSEDDQIISRAPSPERAKRQLLAILSLFLIALSFPLYFLFSRIYQQLESEVIVQYRSAADGVVSRINARLAEVIAPEDARSFDEYNFFRIGNVPLQNTKGLTYSPLAEFPPKTAVPGIIGYFQVNPDGTLQSPTLPKLEGGTTVPGISNEEFAKRVTAWNELSKILAADEAMPASDKKKEPQAQDAPKEQKAAADLAGALSEKRKQAVLESSSASVEAPPARSAEKDSELSMGQIAEVVLGNSVASQQVAPDRLLDESRVLENARKVTELNLDAKYLARDDARKPLSKNESAESQSADNFQARSRRKERLELPVSAGPLEEVAREPMAQTKSNRTAEGSKIRESSIPLAAGAGVPSTPRWAGRGARLAASSAPQPASAPSAVSADSDAAPTGRQSAVRVLTLEGEVDPFQFRVIDSGHFLFIRKVWRDGQRYLQGFVIDAETLMQHIVAQPFQTSSLAAAGTLVVGYRGIYFRRVNGTGAMSMPRMNVKEIVLQRSLLASPLDKVEVLFTMPELPVGPGAKVVNTLAYALVLILLAGIYAMYRLGVKQIMLAKERSDFVSAVSHELKTPLTSIRMYSEMLRSGWVGTEEKKKSYYDYIFQESERLSRLIANVLQFARLSNSKSPLELKTESAKKLLELATEKIKSQVDAAGFQLKTEYEDRRSSGAEEAMVEIEEDAFSRIAINLVDNALKFSAKSEQKEIILSVRVEQRDVTFSVRDFGPGVPREKMKKIFRLFYRAEDQMNRSTPGTGIGLALVRELASKMSASVDLRNHEPGAEFLLRLPIRKAASAAAR